MMAILFVFYKSNLYIIYVSKLQVMCENNSNRVAQWYIAKRLLLVAQGLFLHHNGTTALYPSWCHLESCMISPEKESYEG